MAKTKELIVEKKGPICTLILNRPEKRNSLTPLMTTEIHSILEELKKENKVRAVIITGAGEKAFSAGYDISAIPKERWRTELSGGFRENHPLEVGLRAVENFPYPVIALVKGYAFGGGCELAVTCDLRVASDNAVFRMPPAKLGVLYSFSGVKKFLNLIGPGYTREMFLVGRSIDAKRAEKMGLVNFVLSKEEVEGFTYSLAEEIAENAPLSMSGTKEMINAWVKNQRITAEDEELIKEINKRVLSSEDFKEGQRAFTEKRKPRFRGR